MKHRLHLTFAVALCAASTASATCYTAVNAQGDIIYQSVHAPVDMSRALSDTVPHVFPPGTHLTFVNNNDELCRSIGQRADGQPGYAGTAAAAVSKPGASTAKKRGKRGKRGKRVARRSQQAPAPVAQN